MTRIKKKRWILLSVLVVLVAAGVVIWLLTPPQQRTLTVEEHQEEAPPPADDSWMEDVRPLAENPPDLTYEEVQSQLDIARAQIEAGTDEEIDLPPLPRNYQMKAPPPSPDQLQPGATTEVEPLVYEKPLLSLTPRPDDPYYYFFDPFDPLVMYYMELHGMVDYHNLEKISVEEALQAEYLYLMWEFDGTMRAYIQLGYPVEYYRILDYEPMTVIGVTQGIYTQTNFAIRDGRLQRFLL